MPRVRYYMHTLEGRPAYFDGDQIVYANRGRVAWRKPAVLRRSLEEISADQIATERFRMSQKYPYTPGDYSHVCVEMPVNA